MSCSLLLIPRKYPALNSYNEARNTNTSALLGFISFSCFSSTTTSLRNYRRRSNSNATSVHGGGRRLLSCKCQLADLAPVTSAAYGAILLGGGLFAFGRSGSKGSLFGGLTGGALMATAYFLMQTPETEAIGDALGFGSAFLFSSVFGIRLAATRKLIPSGLLLALSICTLAVFISAYLQDNLTADLV